MPCLRQGRPFESLPAYQKRVIPNGITRFWRECPYRPFRQGAPYQRFSVSNLFRFHPHPCGMRLKPEGLSHGLTKCPPDTLLPCLRQGRPFESLPAYQKRVIPNGITRFWYAGRDSNPQPSEPESDALSIEPPAHLLYSLNIIARIFPFVKRESEIFPGVQRY